MDPLLISSLLQALATLASDPALGYRGNSIVSAIRLMSIAVSAGVQGKAELEQLHSLLKQMVDERREPTKAEWAELRQQSDAAHDILNPPPPPPADDLPKEGQDLL